MAVTKPNDPAAPVNPAAFVAQAAPDQFDTDLVSLGFQASGVISGCAVTQRAAGANMSVDVAAGTVEVAGTQVAVTGTNVAVTAAHATLPRIDIVVVTNAGVVSVVAGTAHANPCDPPIPASRAVLAEIYVPAAVTSIITSYLTDKRVIVGLVSIANVMPTAATLVMYSRVTGDTQDRVQLQADGKLLFGPGNAAQDTNFYREAAGRLKTDGHIVVGDGVSSGSKGLVGLAPNNQQASNVPPFVMALGYDTVQLNIWDNIGTRAFRFYDVVNAITRFYVGTGGLAVGGTTSQFGVGTNGAAGSFLEIHDYNDGANVGFTAGGTGADIAILLRPKGNGSTSLQTAAGATQFAVDPGGVYAYDYIYVKGSKGFISREQSGAGNGVLYVRVSGDAQDRYTLFANGAQYWGPGSTSADIIQDRAGAGLARFVFSPGNAVGGLQIKLNAAGTAAWVYSTVFNDAGTDLYNLVTSSTYTTAGLIVAGAAALYTDNAPLMMIINAAAASDIVVCTGGFNAANERLRFVSSDGSTRVTQQTLGNVVRRLTSIATNDDPTEDVVQGRVATTDATVTTIQTIAASASQSTYVVAHVVARRTGGAAGTAEDAAAYYIRALFKNVAGTATQIGATTSTVIGESVAAYDCTFAVSGGNILLQVTGVASTNITWHSTVYVYRVGT